VLLVGLTGGIGSGKSTVARMLEKRGAVVFDADVLAREAVQPGTPGHAAVIERFGADVLAPGGELDREALASIVFADPAARRDLEAIVHPEVRRRFAEGTEAYRDTDRIVVFSAPLLVETGMHSAFEVLVVVSASNDRQIERLMRDRGMSEDAVRSRIAAQATHETRAEVADVLVDNEGTIEELEQQVERLWFDLSARS
jgi:dephospho-CoA kinase